MVRQVEANKRKCSSKCWFHWRGCLNLRSGSIWLPKNLSRSHQTLHFTLLFLTLLYHSSTTWKCFPFVSTWKYIKCAWADRAQISAIERSMNDIGKPPSESHALLIFLSPPGALYLFPLLSPCIWLCLTKPHVWRLWLDQDVMKPDNIHSPNHRFCSSPR